MLYHMVTGVDRRNSKDVIILIGNDTDLALLSGSRNVFAILERRQGKNTWFEVRACFRLVAVVGRFFL